MVHWKATSSLPPLAENTTRLTDLSVDYIRRTPWPDTLRASTDEALKKHPVPVHTLLARPPWWTRHSHIARTFHKFTLHSDHVLIMTICRPDCVITSRRRCNPSKGRQLTLSKKAVVLCPLGCRLVVGSIVHWSADELSNALWRWLKYRLPADHYYGS